MAFHWLQRLFARKPGTGTLESAVAIEDGGFEPPILAIEDASAEPPRFTTDDEPAEPPRFTTDDEPAEPPVFAVEHEAGEPAPAAEPHPPLPAAVPAQVASSASLGRSLASRIRLLLDGSAPEALKSDAPVLVEALLECSGAVIRRPPDAIQRAFEVSRDPRSGPAALAALFEDDPVLMRSLLTMADSAYHAHGAEPLASLHDAVCRVGPRMVESLLVEDMVQGLLCRPGGPFDAMMRMTWSHMQRTAPIARAIAPEWGVPPDTAYASALLHDVGKLVIFDHVATLQREEGRDLRIPEDFFRDLLRHLHEPVGGLALLRWGMGGEAAYAVGEHHRQPPPEQPSPLTEVLFVAEAVELAHANHARLDWDAIWTQGAITADAAAVEQRLPAGPDAV